MKCCLCEGLCNPKLKFGEYALFWCEHCDFGRLGGVFTPDKVASFYGPSYYTHGPASMERPLSLLGKLRLHLAWRFDYGVDLSPSEFPPGDSACDLGCGDGSYLKFLSRAGFKELVGIDPDANALAHSSGLGTIYQATAEQLPIEVSNRKFDIVLMSHALEHCINPVAAIESVKMLLAQGGTAIIEVPNNRARGFQRFGSAWPWSDIPRHLSFFTECSLSLILEKAGLIVSNRIYVGYVRQFSSSWLAIQRGLARSEGGDFSQMDAWKHLIATLNASSQFKYDSIRVHARHA